MNYRNKFLIFCLFPLFLGGIHIEKGKLTEQKLPLRWIKQLGEKSFTASNGDILQAWTEVSNDYKQIRIYARYHRIHPSDKLEIVFFKWENLEKPGDERIHEFRFKPLFRRIFDYRYLSTNYRDFVEKKYLRDGKWKISILNEEKKVVIEAEFQIKPEDFLPAEKREN
ncbi:MAG: hypothetical protein H7A25_06140 [Leptospiraceae bacterium]|nr:hypothetical protein [Leptospiraceae bacterium]MCP5499463.1 hypothetical protein [Leptospiraceae bacterium]